jgi:hypothetical protein
MAEQVAGGVINWDGRRTKIQTSPEKTDPETVRTRSGHERLGIIKYHRVID